MDQVIVEFVNSTPEPSEGVIVRIPPTVYQSLINSVPSDTVMMEGVDVYAYSSMVTYVDARYQDFPQSSIDYCRLLLANYLDALTSINKAVMYLLFNGTNKPVMDKFRRIVYWNWINVNTLFRSTIYPVVETSTISDVLDLAYIEETFRARYPY